MKDKLLTSRTRAESDWSCGRKRYWQYEYDGTGLEPETTALELYIGTVLHDGLAAIATGKGIDEIASTANKEIFDALINHDSSFYGERHAREQSALVDGLLRGFYRSVWPPLMAEFPEIIAVEKEISLVHDITGKLVLDGGFEYNCIPDLVLGDKDGNLRYVEYKSTSSKKDQWINSWSYAIQVHATASAVSQANEGKSVTSQVVGLYKGWEQYGKLSSPLVYGYFKAGNPPFSQDQWLYEYRSGFNKKGIWTRDGGMKRWIEEMDLFLLSEQFPLTGPIFIKENLVTEYLAQRACREVEIDMAKRMLEASDGQAKDQLMRAAFPQRFSACNPGWGYECPFIRLCHGEQGVDPTEHGFIKKERR